MQTTETAETTGRAETTGTAEASGTATAAAAAKHPPRVEVPHLSFDEFARRGVAAISRDDVPVVVRMPAPVDRGAPVERIKEVLGDSTVALFRKSKDPWSPERSVVTKIRLSEFFDESVYNAPGDTNWYRIVTNIRNRPDDITRLLGVDLRKYFDYQAPLNSANVWLNYRDQFGRSHFDEFENFNIQLIGSKRFLLMAPGVRNFYTRSLLRGFGHHSAVPDLERADLERFPRLREELSTLRSVVLEPGQMLYLPLGWWHQVHPLGHFNVNLNFWLKSPKILKRPYVLVDALYKATFRKLMGRYDYQPEALNAK
ncbi:MAG TPA: cupin-like domain-containing protein [Longimicrobium sp.]|nr:cupin-like domain-containing protein [Longimicrobium sp.]